MTLYYNFMPAHFACQGIFAGGGHGIDKSRPVRYHGGKTAKRSVRVLDLIVLSGLPASGKSTVARALQGAFPYPILEKDRIKECLFDTLGFQSHEEKRRLDGAASRILLQVAEDILSAGGSVILDNNFDVAAGAELRALQSRLGPRCVTLLVSADEDTLYARYLARDLAHTRHPGHAVSDRYPPLPGDPEVAPQEREGFAQRYLSRGMGQVSWDGPVVHVDTTRPLDRDALVEEVREALEGQ